MLWHLSLNNLQLLTPEVTGYTGSKMGGGVWCGSALSTWLFLDLVSFSGPLNSPIPDYNVTVGALLLTAADILTIPFLEAPESRALRAGCGIE